MGQIGLLAIFCKQFSLENGHVPFISILCPAASVVWCQSWVVLRDHVACKYLNTAKPQPHMGWRTYSSSSLLTRAVGLVYCIEPRWAMRNAEETTDTFQGDSLHHLHSEERWEVLQQGPQHSILANKVLDSIYASGPHTTHKTKNEKRGRERRKRSGKLYQDFTPVLINVTAVDWIVSKIHIESMLKP